MYFSKKFLFHWKNELENGEVLPISSWYDCYIMIINMPSHKYYTLLCSVDETKHDYFIQGTKNLQHNLEDLLLESEDSDTLLQTMFLLFKLHNQGQLLVDAARLAYIVTHDNTELCKWRVIRMTRFEDKKKIMLRLMQQNTKGYEDDIVTELRNSARSCMLAGNEAQSATFMQNILFTSGMFTFHSVSND